MRIIAESTVTVMRDEFGNAGPETPTERSQTGSGVTVIQVDAGAARFFDELGDGVECGRFGHLSSSEIFRPGLSLSWWSPIR